MKDRQDLEMQRKENEQYGRRLCLRIKNIKKLEKESKSSKQLSVCLVMQVLIFQMLVLIMSIVSAELVT